MAATFIGYKVESRRGHQDARGKMYEDVAIVRGALTIPEAILAVGMPAYGSAHPDDADVKCSGFQPEEISEDGTFFIRVMWQTPGLGSADQSRTFQGAEWSHSLTSQRVTEDLDGEPIGRRHYIKTILVPGPQWSKLIHEGAQLGTDVQVAYSQVELIMPLPSPYPAATVHSLIGKVNNATMTLDGISFLVGEVILMGARASRLQPQPFPSYDVRYLFAVGRSQLPSGITPLWASDFTAWSETTIPLQYGYSTIYEPVDEAGALATTQETIAESRPYRILVHRLFEAANLSALGVT